MGWRFFNSKGEERVSAAGAPSVGVIGRLTSDVVVNNTVAETNLADILVPANALGTAGVLELDAWGGFLNNSGVNPGGPRFKLKFGGTTLLDTNAPAAAAYAQDAVRTSWRIHAKIMNRGAAGSQSAFIQGNIQLLPNTIARVAFTTGEGYTSNASILGMFFQGWNSGAVDTSVDRQLQLAVILNAASAACEIVLKGAVAKIL